MISYFPTIFRLPLSNDSISTAELTTMAEAVAVVGLIAAIIQIVDLGKSIVQRLQDFRSKTNEIPGVFRDICTQLPLLLSDLERTKEQAKASEIDLDTQKSVLALVQGCQGHIQLLYDRLLKTLPDASDSSWRSGKKAVLSFYQDEKVRVLAEKIRDSVIYLTHHSVISKGQNDRVNFRKLSHEDEKLKILEWLSVVDPSTHHHRAVQQRELDTGLWFFQLPEFKRWKTSTRSFAWLYGIPGCGKTVLCSTIIEDMQNYCSQVDSCTLAYFYFDFNDALNLNVHTLLRSLIKQICAGEDTVPQMVQTLVSRHRASGQQPSITVLIAVLHALVDYLQKQTFIILDALDEYPETKRLELLNTLKRLLDFESPGIHVLATSQERHDIQHKMTKLATEKVCIQSSLVDPDISLYVRTCLAEDPKLDILPAHIKREIQIKLSEGAHGMFRWAVCQLDVLKTCKKPSATKKALEELPKTLDGTYERILGNIEAGEVDEARSILQWLAFSERPLTLEEVAEAAIMKVGGDPIDPGNDRLYNPREVLRICQSLISLSRENLTICGERKDCEVVRFAHFSVKEYLLSDRISKGSAGAFSLSAKSSHMQIAECCLSILLQNNEKRDFPPEPEDLPLLRYSAEFWFKHVQKCGRDADHKEPLAGRMTSLFGGSSITFKNWLSIYDINFRRGARNCNAFRLGSGPSPLYYSALLGFVEPTRDLLSSESSAGRTDVEAFGGKYGTPLVAASTCGSEEIVTLLLDRGADVNAFSGLIYGHALHAASFHGYEPIVRLLIDRGANINDQRVGNDTALTGACERGHKSIVRFLLDNGADINLVGGGYGTALQVASERGHSSIVELLLSRGANVNIQGGHFGQALQAAASRGNESIVRLLLDASADVNAQGGGFRDALRAASIRKHDNVVRLLLDRGATVELIVQFLLEEHPLRTNAESESDQELGRALQGDFDQGRESLMETLRASALRVAKIEAEKRTASRSSTVRKLAPAFGLIVKTTMMMLRKNVHYEGD